MAIVHIINEIAMTGYAVAGLRGFRGMMGTCPDVAYCTIVHHRKGLAMAARASVSDVRITVTI
jgi:hypothetical protein